MKRPAQRHLVAAALLTACVGLSAIGTAIAQGTDPEGAAPQAHSKGRHEHMAQNHARHREQHHTEQLAQLKSALKLNSGQEAAWQAYAVRTAPKAPTAPTAGGQDKAILTTPERLDQLLALKAQRDAQMTRQIDATRQFYAVLTPEQQKVFDAQPMLLRMGMKVKGEHRMHREMHQNGVNQPDLGHMHPRFDAKPPAKM